MICLLRTLCLPGSGMPAAGGWRPQQHDITVCTRSRGGEDSRFQRVCYAIAIQRNLGERRVKEREDPLVGTRVREYEILELIGKGGMGAVDRARHTGLDQERAIKVIQSGLAGDTSFVDRFIPRLLRAMRCCICSTAGHRRMNCKKPSRTWTSRANLRHGSSMEYGFGTFVREGAPATSRPG